MDLERQIHEAIGKTSVSLLDPADPHVLIVSDDDTISKDVEVILSHAGLTSELAKSMAAGCEFAKSGRFQVVVTTAVLSDGTWKRLIHIANRYRPGFMVIVLATTFDVKQGAKALEDGVFDVVDALHELPKVGEAARRALWAAYLEGAGPLPEALIHPRAV
jgi:DNA-binding NtrC family response regulator